MSDKTFLWTIGLIIGGAFLMIITFTGFVVAHYFSKSPEERYLMRNGITLINIEGHRFIKTSGGKYHGTNLTHHPDCWCKPKQP